MKKFTEKFYDGKVYRSFNSLWKISFYILENSIYKFLELSYLINSFLSYRHCFCSYCLLGHLLQTLLLLLWKFCLSPLLNLPNVLTGLFHSFYRLHQIKHSFHLQYEILTLMCVLECCVIYTCLNDWVTKFFWSDLDVTLSFPSIWLKFDSLTVNDVIYSLRNSKQ